LRLVTTGRAYLAVVNGRQEIRGRRILGSHIEGEDIMKLSKLFMMALLAGTLGAFGCSDDETNGGGSGGSGTGGSGGSTADPCTGGLCDTADVKIDCDAARAACKVDTTINMTDAECDAAATEFYCVVGDPGTGGAGGDGGGGAGGASGVAGCDVGLCLNNAERKAACEEFMPACILFCEGEGSAESCGEDECIAFALVFICKEQ
jgi:hypothetical protein